MNLKIPDQIHFLYGGQWGHCVFTIVILSSDIRLFFHFVISVFVHAISIKNGMNTISYRWELAFLKDQLSQPFFSRIWMIVCHYIEPNLLSFLKHRVQKEILWNQGDHLWFFFQKMIRKCYSIWELPLSGGGTAFRPPLSTALYII